MTSKPTFGQRIIQSLREATESLERGEPAGRHSIVIVVPGSPMGKPRMTRRDKWANRRCVVAYRAWADECRLRGCGRVPPAARVARLRVFAHFEPPKSWSKRRREDAIGTPHRNKPDCDNVLKAVMDALWSDDSSISDASIMKLWGVVGKTEIVIDLAYPMKAR